MGVLKIHVMLSVVKLEDEKSPIKYKTHTIS